MDSLTQNSYELSGGGGGSVAVILYINITILIKFPLNEPLYYYNKKNITPSRMAQAYSK